MIVDTPKSWSVAAWVWLSGDYASDIRTVLSQDNDHLSNFYVQYCPPGKGSAPDSLCLAKWKTPNGEETLGVAGEAHPEANRWIHIAVVQDVSRKSLQVYIDGELAREQTYAAADNAFEWKAEGSTAIGRGKWADANVDLFNNGEIAVTLPRCGVTLVTIAL